MVDLHAVSVDSLAREGDRGTAQRSEWVLRAWRCYLDSKPGRDLHERHLLEVKVHACPLRMCCSRLGIMGESLSWRTIGQFV